MLRKTILTFLVSIVCVYGVENATENEFPWLVNFNATSLTGESFLCTGALIDWVKSKEHLFTVENKLKMFSFIN